MTNPKQHCRVAELYLILSSEPLISPSSHQVCALCMIPFTAAESSPPGCLPPERPQAASHSLNLYVPTHSLKLLLQRSNRGTMAKSADLVTS